ncbi:MAG: hypothetical protein ABWW65_05605 [Thermoprotei archaeon]
MSSDLPFFADASIVGDYKPLKKYWELLKRRGKELDDAFLKREDFEYLEEVVNVNPGIDVESLLNMLTSRFVERVDCKVAVEAYKEAYGFELKEDEACKGIARIMAGWLIEAGRNIGILKYRYSWKDN